VIGSTTSSKNIFKNYCDHKMERCHNQVCMIGVEFVGGNMFESIPSGDAIFMKVLIAFLIIYIHQKY
jgi:hypothetical protein